jgi:hypothetical protein
MNLKIGKLSFIFIIILAFIIIFLTIKFNGCGGTNRSVSSADSDSRFENLDQADQKFLKELGYTHISEGGFPYKYIRDLDGKEVDYGQYLEYRLLMKEGDSIVRRSTDMRPEMKTQLMKQPKNKLKGIDAIGDIVADLSTGDVINTLTIDLDSLKKLYSIDPSLNKITNWVVQIISAKTAEEMNQKIESLRHFKDSLQLNSKDFINQLNIKLLEFYVANKKQNTFGSYPIQMLPKTGGKMVHITKTNDIKIKKYDRVKCLTHLIKNTGAVEYSNFNEGNFEDVIFGVSKLNPVIEDALNMMSKGDEVYVIIPWLLAIDNFKFGQKPPEGTDLIIYIKLLDISEDHAKYDLQ